MQSVWRNRLLAGLLAVSTSITVAVLIWLLSSVQSLDRDTNEISDFFRDNRLWHLSLLHSELHKFRFELLSTATNYTQDSVTKASLVMELIWNQLDVLISIKPNRRSAEIEEDVLRLFGEMLEMLELYEDDLYQFTPEQINELLAISDNWLEQYRLLIQDLHILQFSLIRNFSRNTTQTYDRLSLQMLFLFGFVLSVQMGLTALMIYYAKASKRADIANNAKSDFLASMTHELRTPLNGVLGTIQLMQDTTEFNKDMLDTLQASSESLNAQINDILDFSRVETGEMLLDEQVFELHALIQQIKLVVAPSARNNHVALKVEKSIELDDSGREQLWMNADATKLRQILLNLLNNAIKFTEPGGTVRLIVEARHNTLMCAVDDTGIGIAAEVQQQVFEPFRQAQSSTSRKYGGTGLGLAISRRLALLMSGELSLESTLGEGSRFTLKLPLQRVQAPEDPPAVPALTQKELIAPRLSSNNLRVLLVEDNEINQKVALAMLTRLEIVADLATNGEEALQHCHENDYDCVLMDIQMPGMDGFQCTQELRARGFRKPIFALTANSSEDIRQRSIAVGMNDFLTKPIRMETLKEKLTQLS